MRAAARTIGIGTPITHAPRKCRVARRRCRTSRRRSGSGPTTATRVAVSGCSYGGIQTLLVAGKEVGLRAAVPFAPGAIMWPRSPEVRERLLRAAREARVPVLLIQAENDYDLGPSRVAGAELARAGRGRHEVRVYPPYGTTHQDGHGGFCRRGFDVWGRDVLDFLTRSFATTPPGRA